MALGKYEEFEVREVVPFGTHFKLESLHSVAEFLEFVHVYVKVQAILARFSVG